MFAILGELAKFAHNLRSGTRERSKATDGPTDDVRAVSRVTQWTRSAASGITIERARVRISLQQKVADLCWISQTDQLVARWTTQACPQIGRCVVPSVGACAVATMIAICYIQISPTTQRATTL